MVASASVWSATGFIAAAAARPPLLSPTMPAPRPAFLPLLFIFVVLIAAHPQARRPSPPPPPPPERQPRPALLPLLFLFVLLTAAHSQATGADAAAADKPPPPEPTRLEADSRRLQGRLERTARDVVLWRSPRRSLSVLAVSTAVWAALHPLGLNCTFLTAASWAAIAALTSLFLFSNLVPLLGRDPPDLSALEAVHQLSAGNDYVVGNLVAETISRVERKGVVRIDKGRCTEDSLKFEEGIHFNRGYLSPYFVTDRANMLVKFQNSKLLLVDKKVTDAKEMFKILDSAVKEKYPLLIIAEGIEEEALAPLIRNKLQGVLNVTAIKAPAFGERESHYLDDTAILTGG